MYCISIGVHGVDIWKGLFAFRHGTKNDSDVEADLQALIDLTNKYRWSGPELRERLEAGGVRLPRSDFYSETPTLEDIQNSFEYEAGAAKPIFHDESIFSLDRMVALVDRLATHTRTFSAPADEVRRAFYWKNPQFSRSDAMALYGMVREYRPATIVEIGCGFSSYMARRALDDVGASGRLVCIDPDPRADIQSLAGIEFVPRPVQDIPIDYFLGELSPGDFVFYDGSHTLKTGSDAVHFYLRILPYLQKGIIVHAHDAPLPFPLPMNHLIDHKLSWAEPYLLMAHLHNTRRYRVLLSNGLVGAEVPAALDRMMDKQFESGGTSLWYEIIGE
jgi:predicted O-methyltransferase YrrM